MVVTIKSTVGAETRVVTVPVGVKERVTRFVTAPVTVMLPAVEMDVATLVLKYLSVVSTKPVTVTVTRPHTVYVTHIVSHHKKYVNTLILHMEERLKEEARRAEEAAKHLPVVAPGAKRLVPPKNVEVKMKRLRVS